jgi:hypothetical protein
MVNVSVRMTNPSKQGLKCLHVRGPKVDWTQVKMPIPSEEQGLKHECLRL